MPPAITASAASTCTCIGQRWEPREITAGLSQPVQEIQKRPRGRPRKDPSANISSRKADSRPQIPPEEEELNPKHLHPTRLNASFLLMKPFRENVLWVWRQGFLPAAFRVGTPRPITPAPSKEFIFGKACISQISRRVLRQSQRLPTLLQLLEPKESFQGCAPCRTTPIDPQKGINRDGVYPRSGLTNSTSPSGYRLASYSYRALSASCSLTCKLASLFARVRTRCLSPSQRVSGQGYMSPARTVSCDSLLTSTKKMDFRNWARPLLNYYKDEREIFTTYIRPNKHGTFSVRNAQKAQARFGVSARYLYKVRGGQRALRDFTRHSWRAGLLMRCFVLVLYGSGKTIQYMSSKCFVFSAA
jgi:hypothetical protein